MKQNFVSLTQSLISKELEDGEESKRQWNIITTKAVTTLINAVHQKENNEA